MKSEKLPPYSTKELMDKFEGIPNNIKPIQRVRIHQGWWRLNILNQKAGQHPIRKEATVCNAILNGEETGSNFLSDAIFNSVKETLNNRTAADGGKIEEKRLYNNLLSSQPLCFNFFAALEIDKVFGLKILQLWWSDVTQLNKVLFEYSPPENYTKDGSAFDVAFDVQLGEKRGLIGLECKYTDSFSYKPSNSKIFYGDMRNKNFNIYSKYFFYRKTHFLKGYYDYVRSKDYNQLFRNQLIAVAMLHHKKYDVVKTGLFCYEQDKSAVKTGLEFQAMLSNGKEVFTTITYQDFITAVQQLELTWQQREWTMLLWARYCGMQLSEEVYKQIN